MNENAVFDSKKLKKGVIYTILFYLKSFIITHIALKYVCYQCHNTSDGEGGGGSAKTLEELSAYAKETLHKCCSPALQKPGHHCAA